VRINFKCLISGLTGLVCSLLFCFLLYFISCTFRTENNNNNKKKSQVDSERKEIVKPSPTMYIFS
jgi:hypothetical protein